LLAGAGVLAVTIIFGTQWAWPWYVEQSLRTMGWENGSDPGSAVYRGGRRIPYTWALRYKPEWKEVYARAGLTSRDAKDLSRAGQIEKLHVDGRILPGTLAPLVRLPRLLHLSLITDVRAADLRDLRDSPALESIYVHSSDGQGIDFYAALAEIQALRRVVIGSSVTAEELEPLSRLPNLRVLIVPGLRPSPGLARVFQGMPQLQQVGLGGGNWFPFLGPELRNACPKLEVLPNDGGPLSDSNDDEMVFEQQDDPSPLQE
jgi:hypothetical protein